MEAPSFDINLESSQIDIFRKILEVFNIHQHHSKRVCKLHERLGERQGLLSVSGAIKLYKSYDLCLQSAKKQLL